MKVSPGQAAMEGDMEKQRFSRQLIQLRVAQTHGKTHKINESISFSVFLDEKMPQTQHALKVFLALFREIRTRIL